MLPRAVGRAGYYRHGREEHKPKPGTKALAFSGLKNSLGPDGLAPDHQPEGRAGIELAEALEGGAFLRRSLGRGLTEAVQAALRQELCLVELGAEAEVPLGEAVVLGEAIEPTQVDRVDAWWRAIAALERDGDPVAEPKPEEHDAIGWPLD